MTNRISLWLAGIILLLLVADGWLQQFAATLFLGKKLIDLIEWLAFWR